MKILLFGNKGQIGREIEQLAKSKSMEITGLDIDNVDITNLDRLEQIFKQNKDATLVINTAAYTDVEQAEDEPGKAFQVNCNGARNLATLCQKYNLPILHLSTDYVFSGDKTGPYAESDTTEPLGIYGKSKLAGDQAIASNCPKHVILRVSWVFGRYGKNFVKTMLRLAQEREAINVVGDHFGCPTEAADIARVLLEISEKISHDQETWGTYNYCNHPVTNWYEFTTKIDELGRNQLPLKVKQINKITTAEFPTKTKRPKNSELLVAKICKDWRIERMGWEECLAKVIYDLYKTNAG
jgi:dTDP-4-dehydrorhamnose reductase